MIIITSVPQANFFFSVTIWWPGQKIGSQRKKMDGHSAILHDALNVQLKCCQTIAIERHHARIHGHAR